MWLEKRRGEPMPRNAGQGISRHRLATQLLTAFRVQLQLLEKDSSLHLDS
jgi:hypothetical protein